MCGNRYRLDSLKENVHKRRYGKESHTEPYGIRKHLKAPEAGELLADSTSKANLQNYICSRWEEEETTSESRSVGQLKLLFLEGFTDESKAILLMAGQVSPVHELESNQEEADTRMILHAIYCLHELNFWQMIQT